jgi:HD-like signal output (HDOD) protein/CheY-like chemotaxis protein
MSTPAKTRALFVDDEPQILQIIELAMEPLKDQWEMAFAPDALYALGLLENKSFDVVVSDMRMPNMSGADLFAEVQQRWPSTVRIILSGYAEPEQVMKGVATAHQFMRKPFTLKEFLATLQRIQQLQQWVMYEPLRGLVGKMKHLPSIPLVYFLISQALQSPDTHADHIAEIAATDPALTAKMLQLVNSAYFGGGYPISNVTEAVVILGVNNIRAMAMAAHLFSAFDMTNLGGLPLQEICARGIRIGNLAMKIAKREQGSTQLLEQAFTAGALHNIGQLIFAANLPTQYAALYRSTKSRGQLEEEERRVFSSSHADVGAYLLAIWGLPSPLVEAVGFHHEPSRSKDTSFTPLTAVHVARGLLQEAPSRTKTAPFDTKYLARLELTDRVDVWRQCLRDSS